MWEESKVLKEIGTVSNPILSFVTPIQGFEGDDALSPWAAICRAIDKRQAHTSQGTWSHLRWAISRNSTSSWPLTMHT